MRRALLTILVVSSTLPAGATNRPWLAGTASTLEDGRVEMGLFQPLRIGVSDQLEVSLAPLIALLSPNITLRYAWCGGITTEHSANYPTPLLMVLAREGTGGIIPSTTRVPHILTITNTALVTIDLARDQLFTTRLGLTVGGMAGESTLPTIDLPLVFPRSAAWHEGFVARLGADFDGRIAGPLWYSVDADLFLIPSAQSTVHLEHSIMLSVEALAWLRVELGYKLAWGQYPFGTDLHILPLFDLSFALAR